MKNAPSHISILIGLLLFFYGVENWCGFVVLGCALVGLGVVFYDSNGPTVTGRSL